MNRDSLSRVQGEPAAEHGEASKERLVLRRNEVMTPGDRVPHRAVAVWRISRATRQHRQPPPQPRKQRLGRQQPNLRRRQFDRQRQPVQPMANPRDRSRVFGVKRKRGVNGAGAFDEELDSVGVAEPFRWVGSVGQRQGRYEDLVFPRNAQRRPTRGEDAETGAGAQEMGHERRRLDDLLEVVEDEQKPPLPQHRRERLRHWPVARLAPAKRRRDRWGDEVRIIDWRQRHEGNAVWMLQCQHFGYPQRQPSLPNATRAGQCDQAHTSTP